MYKPGWGQSIFQQATQMVQLQMNRKREMAELKQKAELQQKEDRQSSSDAPSLIESSNASQYDADKENEVPDEKTRKALVEELIREEEEEKRRDSQGSQGKKNKKKPSKK